MKVFSGQPSEWNTLVSALPNSHLLQSWEWGGVKAKYGWKPVPFIWETPQADNSGSRLIVAAAIILKRIIPLKGFSARLCVLYIPRGPVMDWMDQELRQKVLNDLQLYARDQRAIFIKMDPDLVLGTGIPGTDDQRDNDISLVIKDELESRKWLFSNDQIQFRNTAMIDLSASEDEIKANLKQKTRYNINLASRKGVIVRTGTLEDLPLLFNMYAETSIRDGFVIRDEGYYQTVWNTFMSSPNSDNMPFAVPLIAEVAGEPVAAVFVFGFASRAYYLYGMSRDIHREKMPNYLLQWEAIKLAREVGCLQYDLWGAPDEFNDKDPLWGVFRFKVGLGGLVIRTLGAWDYPANPFYYQVYTQTLPKILNLMRLRGKSKTKSSLENQLTT
jgi:lipid II:glycine glycyltransferase (peptidoglycan interpeptide bridge formation enzyme)